MQAQQTNPVVITAAEFRAYPGAPLVGLDTDIAATTLVDTYGVRKTLQIMSSIPRFEATRRIWAFDCISRYERCLDSVHAEGLAALFASSSSGVVDRKILHAWWDRGDVPELMYLPPPWPPTIEAMAKHWACTAVRWACADVGAGLFDNIAAGYVMQVAICLSRDADLSTFTSTPVVAEIEWQKQRLRHLLTTSQWVPQ